jgi:cell division protein FtsB
MLRLKIDRNRLAVGIAAAVVTTIVGGIVWGFGQQVVRARQMRVEEARLEQAVATKQAYHDELTAQLEYVQSDEYVEQWAREDARMARPGEVAVVVLDDADTATEADATPKSTATPEPEPKSFWAELWELIFIPPGQ